MGEAEITIEVSGERVVAERGVILAPAASAETQSFVRRLIPGAPDTAKQVAYTLAQSAVIQLEDGELTVTTLAPGATLTVRRGAQVIESTDGLVIAWTAAGVRVYAHADTTVKRLLKIVHRECTRWIRLDVH